MGTSFKCICIHFTWRSSEASGTHWEWGQYCDIYLIVALTIWPMQDNDRNLFSRRKLMHISIFSTHMKKPCGNLQDISSVSYYICVSVNCVWLVCQFILNTVDNLWYVSLWIVFYWYTYTYIKNITVVLTIDKKLYCLKKIFMYAQVIQLVHITIYVLPNCLTKVHVAFSSFA